MLAAILFDLDGTLINTDELHYQAWQEILNEHHLTINETFYKTQMSGRLNPDIVQDLLPQLDAAAQADLIERKEARFRELAEHLNPMPGLLDVLAWIQQHQLRQAVVTNAPRDNAYFMLRSLNLIEAFNPVVIADDIGIGKPDPAPYQLALQQLGIAPEAALVFEDSPSGVRSAVGARISTIGIASTHPPQVLYDLGAKLVIDDFTDVRLWNLLNSSSKALTLASL